MSTVDVKRLIALALLALISVSSIAAARCYPAGTRVVIFVQGLYTSYDVSGAQGTLAEVHRFDGLKAAFAAKGYAPAALLDFSYTGGTVSPDGAWHPASYTCAQTDRFPADNLAVMEQMLKSYRKAHPNAHFTLVGHSVGGYLSFLEGARDAGRPPGQKLGVDVVVTLDAPLQGISADKKIIIDLLPCNKTYLAGGDLVAQRLDATTPDVRRYQAAVMAEAGVRVATLGNEFDCLFNTGHCVAGGTFIDDTETMFLDGQASVSKRYRIAASPFLSHDAIVADPNAIIDAVAFVGAP